MSQRSADSEPHRESRDGVSPDGVSRKGQTYRFDVDGNSIKVESAGRHLEYEHYEDWRLLQIRKGSPERFDEIWAGSQAKIDSFYDFAEVTASERALEVGFRVAPTLQRLLDRGVDVVGLEVNPASVAAAKMLDVEAYLGDIQQTTHFEPASFHVILMCDVLEHLFDPRGAICECRRLLRPNGRLAIELPLEGEFNQNLLDGHASLFERPELVDQLLTDFDFRTDKRHEYQFLRHHKYRLLARRTVGGGM